MFKNGYTKVLEIKDLYNPIKSDRSMLLGDRLERYYRFSIPIPNTQKIMSTIVSGCGIDYTKKAKQKTKTPAWFGVFAERSGRNTYYWE